VTHATFVGVLVNLAVAAENHLPIKDFFIWFDDLEYTTRLGRSAPGFHVASAAMRHPRQPVDRYNDWRIEHDVKNRLWMLRRGLALGHSDGRRRQYKELANVVFSQLRYAPSKRACARLIVSGARQGLLRRPEMIRPASGLPDRVGATRATDEE
jgi:GT2 family glycosyltransferase